MIGWEIDNNTIDTELYGIGHKLNANELSVKLTNILCDTVLDARGYEFIYISLKRLIYMTESEEAVQEAIRKIRHAGYGIFVTKENLILSPYPEIENYKGVIKL